MLQLDDGRLLLPQGEGWDEGIKKQKALLTPLTLALSLRERGSANFWLKHLANQEAFIVGEALASTLPLNETMNKSPISQG
jgi:hypothetical protein